MAGPSSTSAGRASGGMQQQQGQQQGATGTAAGAPAAPSAGSGGSKLGAYEVLEVIGQGSFGKVCRVRRAADSKVRVCVVRPSAE